MRLLIKLAGTAIVLALVLVVGILMLPAEKLANVVSDQLTRQLQREVKLGAARLSFYPVLGIEADGLEIANADWASDSPMFSADKAGFGLDTSALFGGQIAFRSVRAEQPLLMLQRARDGRVNWSFGASEPSSGAEQTGRAALPELTLDELQIVGGEFVFVDGGETTRVRDADVTMSWPSQSQPITLAATLRPSASQIAVKAAIADPLSLMDGKPVGLTATLRTDGGTARFEGLISTDPSASGALDLDVSNSGTMARALGQVGIKLPRGFGRSVKGQADISYGSDGRLSLREGQFALDQHQMSVSADVTLAAKPIVNAQIRASALDFRQFLSGDDTEAASSGWSKEPIDASALGSFDGDIAITTDGLDLGDYTFGATRVLMQLRDSRAAFDIQQLQGFGGAMTGQFVANNRGGLSVRADLDFQGIDLHRAFTEVLDVDQLTGKANGQVRLLSSGNSIHALVARLGGTAAVQAGPGQIRGVDVKAIFAGDESGGTTEYDSATARFEIDKGQVKNNDLALTVERFTGKGAGRIDLSPRTLDYLLTVTDPQALDGRGLSLPIRIKGPWQDPLVRFDMAQALQDNLAVDAERLKKEAEDAIAAEKAKLERQLKRKEREAKKKAKQEVDKALEKELGVKRKKGQSVEDALKDSLKNEAEKGLRNLLGNGG